MVAFSNARYPLPLKGIKILLGHVATGAMHNSGERFDAPTCHPETRIDLQKDILGWAEEPPDGQLVTWMYGPAGAGKSAIAQTVSQKLHAKGQLTASFFFSRASDSRGRGDESALIATLAYQLSLNTPATRPFIARAVRENPLIFELSLDDQVQALIVNPLTSAYQDNCPRIIVVDGLDECRKSDNAQTRVVNALVKGISSVPHLNHKLFITSRPEHDIVAIFRNYKPELLRKVELNKKWNPDDDIRTFLIAEFANIRRSHPYFESRPADQAWPSSADINALVKRSSGQFIYTSVVIKYIKSEDYYDPASRLEVILRLQNNEDRPYIELDALYKHIFSQTQRVENVLIVLSLERMLSESEFASFVGLAQFLSHFVGVQIEEIKFWLRPLVSLLTWETDATSGKDVIQYLHASLPDFLTNESRSDAFYIYSIPIAIRVVQRALDLLEGKDIFAVTNVDFMSVLLKTLRYYAERPSLRTHVLSMLSNFNFVENVLSRTDVTILSRQKLEDLGSYLEWILRESERDPQQALEMHLSQIQTWIIECLTHKIFDDLNTTDQVDLWPFLTTPFPDGRTCMPLNDMLREMSYEIAAAREIYGLSSSSYHVFRDEDVEVSDQAILFRYLTHYIPHWLAEITLLGWYAITGEKYVIALMCTSRYILRLPTDELSAIRNDDHAKFSNIMTAAWRTFSNCVSHLPLDMELYFFVLYMYSAIVDHSRASSKRGRIATSARHYLRLMCQKFLFLSDPASPEYINARENAETTWIETKKDLYDPILSIRVDQLPDLDPLYL